MQAAGLPTGQSPHEKRSNSFDPLERNAHLKNDMVICNRLWRIIGLTATQRTRSSL